VERRDVGGARRDGGTDRYRPAAAALVRASLVEIDK
jgi:hypothetical protein